jgi:hypothetical protein
MSPWQELEYFDFPFVSAVVCPPGMTDVVGIDPRRVVLQLANPTSVPLLTAPGGDVPPLSMGVGQLLPNTLVPVLVVQQLHGPLAQFGWSVFNPTANPVTIQVIQVLLKSWPATK